MSDPSALPARLPLRTWLVASAAFVGTYLLLWCVVHVLADTRPCQLTLDDPLFAWVPHQPGWTFVSQKLYTVFTLAAVGALAYRAFRGDHRPLVRFGAGLSVQGLLRAVTITLLPLCRATRKPGTIVLDRVPTVDLGFAEIPWRMWATNDLVFSGHVGEFLLLTWISRGWPLWWRAALIVFQVLQVYALLATRGHYTIDIVLAVPCAFFADAVAVKALGALSTRRSAPALRPTSPDVAA